MLIVDCLWYYELVEQVAFRLKDNYMYNLNLLTQNINYVGT